MAARDDYDTAMQAVATAIAAAAWETARTQLMVASAHLARIPRTGAHDGNSFTERGIEEIERLRAMVAEEEARGASIELHSSWVP